MTQLYEESWKLPSPHELLVDINCTVSQRPRGLRRVAYNVRKVRGMFSSVPNADSQNLGGGREGLGHTTVALV